MSHLCVKLPLKGKALSNNSKGNVAAPTGSQQQFDYFHERQQQLDIGHMRKQMDQQELDRKLQARNWRPISPHPPENGASELGRMICLSTSTFQCMT
jgi:hypothetical protein